MTARERTAMRRLQDAVVKTIRAYLWKCYKKTPMNWNKLYWSLIIGAFVYIGGHVIYAINTGSF